jgi:hypothetical protein
MELSELQTKQSAKIATRALKEHFNQNLNLDAMGISETRTMLGKVRNLLSEHRSSKQAHQSHQSPAYLKLLMMEQALSGHYGDLSVRMAYDTQIIVENEEVEKSQVVLAAQDILDRIEKMYEQVGLMGVKDLPAVVDGVENEIGVTEAESYKAATQAALDNLRGALEGAQTELKAAIGGITGEGGGAEAAFAPPTGPEEEEAGDALADLAGGGEEPGIEAPEAAEPELPEGPIGGVGRGKR